VSTFDGTLALCTNREHTKYPFPVPNAIVESLLLHTRILVEIFLSRDTEADAVNLKTLLPGFDSVTIGELATLYGKGKDVDSPCRTINKRLAHSTSVRTENFDYGVLMNKLRPSIDTLIEQVRAERAKQARPAQAARYDVARTDSAIDESIDPSIETR
jgi:hypothetical protein